LPVKGRRIVDSKKYAQDVREIDLRGIEFYLDHLGVPCRARANFLVGRRIFMPAGIT